MILTLFCLSAGAFAQEEVGTEKKDYQKINNNEEFYLSDIGLTDEQNKRIELVSVDYSNKILPLRSQLTVRQIELKSLLRDPAVEEEKIHAVAGEVRSLHAKILEMSINYQLEIRRILTPDQIKAWSTFEAPQMKRGRRQ